MRDKIQEILPNHALISCSSNNIYIVDYKDLNGGEVTLHENEPANIKYVYLDNIKPTTIVFDGFKENALPLAIGVHSRQCECVIFPETCSDTDWILFIETKYANDLAAAFDANRDYPNSMLDQIIQSVKYFRDKGIIENNRRVNAIVSFPNLVEEFNSTFFKENLTELDILKQYNILVRPTNSALIKSEKRIVLNSI